MLEAGDTHDYVLSYIERRTEAALKDNKIYSWQSLAHEMRLMGFSVHEMHALSENSFHITWPSEFEAADVLEFVIQYSSYKMDHRDDGTLSDSKILECIGTVRRHLQYDERNGE